MDEPTNDRRPIEREGSADGQHALVRAWVELRAARGAHLAAPWARRCFTAGDHALLPAMAEEGQPFVLEFVSEYAGMHPRARPRAYCPVCGERVTLKLGRRMRHHYAHAPRSGCAAARSEGALHLEAKLHLAATLAAGGDRLGIRLVCAGWSQRAGPPCPPGPAADWEVRWDRVEVEYRVGTRRPDVTLLRGDTAVVALEVYVSHAVDLEKRAALAALGVPWFEVSGHSLLPDGRPPWNPRTPLETRAHWDGAGEWRCPSCAAGHAGETDDRLNGIHRLAWRPVHLYVGDAGALQGSTGVVDLPITMMTQRRDGAPAIVWLTDERTGKSISRRARVPTRGDALETGHRLFLEWAAEQRRRPGCVVDSPVSWQSLGENHAPSRPARSYPMRYRWAPWRQRFARLPNLRAHPWPVGGVDALAGAATANHPTAWTELGAPRAVHLAAAAWWLTLVERPEGLAVHLAWHDQRSWTEYPRFWIRAPRAGWPDRLGPLLGALADGDASEESIRRHLS